MRPFHHSEAIISKYRPIPRNGSTAVVLWRPPPNNIPDLITSAIKSGPGLCSGYTSVPVTTRWVFIDNIIHNDTGVKL